MRVPDNYDLFVQHEQEQQEALKAFPMCDICEQHIQDDYCYEINDTIICEHCLVEYYRKDISDLMG